MEITVTVINKQGLDDDQVLREILKAETNMNAGSLLRFHVQSPTNLEKELETELSQAIAKVIMNISALVKSLKL